MLNEKKIGLIGLGKMGYKVAQRLIEKNYTPVVFDVDQKIVKKIEKEGAIGTSSFKELAQKLTAPKIIILLIPAGKMVDDVISEINPFLTKEDIIIDSGNSYYKDSQQRSIQLKKQGIIFFDAGMSGGTSGARNGACLMIGGDEAAFVKVKEIFEALSNNGSYKYLGKSGAGHLVKGYHNLVEYGYLQALAEGLVSISEVSKSEKLDINLKEVCDIWNKGSIVESRIARDAAIAFDIYPDLEGISGSVTGQTQGEMQKLVDVSKKHGVFVPSCESAVTERIKSQSKGTTAGKIINATRNVFGGHQEWKKQ